MSVLHQSHVHVHIVASVKQGPIIVTTLLHYTWILLSATRSYLSTEFQDEHAKPTCMKDTTLLHSIVLMNANLCTVAHTSLLHFFRYDLVVLTGRYHNDT